MDALESQRSASAEWEVELKAFDEDNWTSSCWGEKKKVDNCNQTGTNHST